MNEKFLRIYKKMDVSSVKKHLLIHGALSAQCANCQTMELKLEELFCPKCETEFKYIAFRNVHEHLPKMHKLLQTRPDIVFIDHDDYKHNVGALKAEEFLK